MAAGALTRGFGLVQAPSRPHVSSRPEEKKEGFIKIKKRAQRLAAAKKHQDAGMPPHLFSCHTLPGPG
jgi:hypothetical protein